MPTDWLTQQLSRELTSWPAEWLASSSNYYCKKFHIIWRLENHIYILQCQKLLHSPFPLATPTRVAPSSHNGQHLAPNIFIISFSEKINAAHPPNRTTGHLANGLKHTCRSRTPKHVQMKDSKCAFRYLNSKWKPRYEHSKQGIQGKIWPTFWRNRCCCWKIKHYMQSNVFCWQFLTSPYHGKCPAGPYSVFQVKNKLKNKTCQHHAQKHIKHSPKRMQSRCLLSNQIWTKSVIINSCGAQVFAQPVPLRVTAMFYVQAPTFAWRENCCGVQPQWIRNFKAT